MPPPIHNQATNDRAWRPRTRRGGRNHNKKKKKSTGGLQASTPIEEQDGDRKMPAPGPAARTRKTPAVIATTEVSTFD
jgi:hypothetical protein